MKLWGVKGNKKVNSIKIFRAQRLTTIKKQIILYVIDSIDDRDYLVNCKKRRARRDHRHDSCLN